MTEKRLLDHEFVEGASKHTWLGQCMFPGCGQNRADHYAAEPAAPSADLALIEEVEALISDVRYIGSIVQHSTLSSLLTLAREALAGREVKPRPTLKRRPSCDFYCAQCEAASTPPAARQEAPMATSERLSEREKWARLAKVTGVPVFQTIGGWLNIDTLNRVLAALDKLTRERAADQDALRGAWARIENFREQIGTLEERCANITADSATEIAGLRGQIAEAKALIGKLNP